MLPLDRFMAKVSKQPNGCWLWIGATRGTRQKRGCFWFQGANWDACRWALSRMGRPPVDGECACHRCDNPLCVNPAHLFWASQAENVADMHNKGRSHHQKDPAVQQRAMEKAIETMRRRPELKARGERHGCAKLTACDAQYIRESNHPTAYLVTQFGVSRSTIQRIRNGNLWSTILRAQSLSKGE
ncbi:MAG: hypothetical protein ACR2QC_04095 [Gammaproteobacteria bacterium]